MLRSTLAFSVLLLACPVAGRAALGGAPEQFENAAPGVSATFADYVTRDTTLATGTRVREYVSAKGIVFAVTWEGPFLPDLKALLGKYFASMVNDAGRMPKAGRSRIAMTGSEVVINSGGHMRAFEGSAWLPAAFPPGFTADDVR
jgi:hypothetical protein